ncbi:MAG: hypothetical protein R2733_12645 [Acidimicrobiales bacterium]
MMPIEQSRIDANWRAIVVELDAPRPGRVERALREVGVPSDITRVMAATPALRRSWFAAVFAVAVIGLLVAGAADPHDAFFTLAVLAPLVPVAGVAMAFGPSSDPAHEIELATPSKGLRLVLVRAATVQAVATVVLGAVSLLSPVAVTTSLAWMLPSFGLTLLTVALMAAVTPRRAATAAAVGWVTTIVVASRRFDDRLDAFGPATQVSALVVAGMALVMLQQRRVRFDLLREEA